jgi:hypothetical protein
MAAEDRKPDTSANGVSLDADKLKEGVDQLLQKDQLSNDKSRAGDKPGTRDDSTTDAEKAKETLKDFHD